MTNINSVRVVYSVQEAAKMLGIARNTAYEAVKTGQLPCIRIGARILIPRMSIEKMLAGEQPVSTIK